MFAVYLLLAKIMILSEIIMDSSSKNKTSYIYSSGSQPRAGKLPRGMQGGLKLFKLLLLIVIIINILKQSNIIKIYNDD